MAKYRKKPIVIEAFQMKMARRWDNSEWPQWLHKAWQLDESEEGCLYCCEGGDDLYISTLEGPMSITFGDWIIQGVRGELYPCKPDIFEAIYEPVEDNG